jgi:DNA-binding transcriptional LysR family regulator|tara:strand:+ start:6856 stop:7764 length:909 start_codon:yes stop_codon:yes gene_type:complete
MQYSENFRLHWDDLRLILAIAQVGSFAAAAEKLGVSTPTVFRKAKALEQRLGTLVFRRDNAGVTLTAAGREAAGLAARFADEIASLEARIGNADTETSGTIRFATVDTLVAGPLMPVLAEFRKAFPQILLDVRSSVGMANLRQREVDAALRAGGEPDGDLVGRRLCKIAVGVYRAHKSAPIAETAIADQDWIVPNGELAHLASAAWLKQEGFSDRAVMQANSLFTLGAAVASGVGLGILPCYFADSDPRLCRIGAPIDALASDLWFLTHAELRYTARMRALSDHLARQFKSLQPLFEGQHIP